MTSNDSDDLLDLDRGLKITTQDVVALRRVRETRPMSLEEYAAAWRRCPRRPTSS